METFVHSTDVDDFDETLEGIIHPANKRYLIWAEPDEGSYNWKLYELGSRYDKDIQITGNIAKYVREHASDSYPIAIIDGWHIDSLLDVRNSLSTHIKHVTKEELSTPGKYS